MIIEKDRSLRFPLLLLVFSPAILCIALGLAARMLVSEGASGVCAAFLSQEILSSMSLMPHRARELALPCPVLAVQASVVLPTAFLIMFLVFRKAPTDDQLGAFKFNIPMVLILLVTCGVAYVLWMDIFFVGAFYDFSVRRRTTMFTWPIKISVISQLAASAMVGVIVIAYRAARVAMKR